MAFLFQRVTKKFFSTFFEKHPAKTHPLKDYEDYEKYYDEIVIPKELYGVHPKAAITERNRWMVTNTDVLVAYIRNESGGTAACVRMAEQLGRAIIKI